MTKNERSKSSQSEKFTRFAREAGCDEDEKAWDERLRKVAGQKPPEDKAE